MQTMPPSQQAAPAPVASPPLASLREAGLGRVEAVEAHRQAGVQPLGEAEMERPLRGRMLKQLFESFGAKINIEV